MHILDILQFREECESGDITSSIGKFISEYGCIPLILFPPGDFDIIIYVNVKLKPSVK